MRDTSAVIDAPAELTARLSDLRRQYPQADPDAVADIVRAVLTTMHGDLGAQETSLLTEVEELGRIIEGAKAEIAALQVDDINGSHIPSATDELDAIVAHTALATNAILETCETLDRVAEAAEGQAAVQLQDATTRIYEACSFQDITGQRITKVVNTLKVIESKVSHLVSTFGDPTRPKGPVATVPVHSPTPDADLLNGPQLPASAMDQSDIDALLASFD
jgi:chemotaxis protein CheZ